MLNPGVVLRGKYEILKIIGRGGMSTVYLARDRMTGQHYAIKDVERSGQDKQNTLVVQSLAVEANMLKRLSNPHLPRIYEIFEETNSILLVMDFVEGESLDKVIARTGAQRVEDIYSWGMQICEVFDYLHNQPQPVVYRDMKPANVILQPNGNIMMIDFGTARTQKVGRNMTSDTVCIGTEGFAAPEQFGGISQSDARTDIFCLGATLYNLYTGHSPCDPPKGILPLSRFDPAMENTPLDVIIRKCTRNDPNERYQTARELYADLQLAQSGAFQKYYRNNGQSSLLRRSGWQMQKIKGSSGGETGALSGLLRRGEKPAANAQQWQQNAGQGLIQPQTPPQAARSAAPTPPPVPKPASAYAPQQPSYQQPSYQQPAAAAYPPQQSANAYAPQQPADGYAPQPEPEAQPAEGGNIWRTVMWILLGASLLLFLLGISCVLLSRPVVGVIILVIAVVFAVLAIVTMLTANRRS